MMIEFFDLNILRLVNSFACGYLLTISGSYIQLMTNNYLAGPSTIGLNAIIVFIILLIFLLPFESVFIHSEVISFSIFILLLVFFIFFIFRFNDSKKSLSFVRKMKSIPKDLILIGLSLNLLIGAVCSIIQFYYISLNKPFPSQLWYGTFKHVTFESTFISLGLVISLFLYNFYFSRKIEFLSYGDELFLNLNFNPLKVIKILFIFCLLSAGVVGCFYGIFSFYGLMLPHILRGFIFFKFSFRREVFWGPIIGGGFLLTLDAMCYYFPFMGTEIPVGILSSILGTAIMLVVIFKDQKKSKI